MHGTSDLRDGRDRGATEVSLRTSLKSTAGLFDQITEGILITSLPAFLARVPFISLPSRCNPVSFCRESLTVLGLKPKHPPSNYPGCHLLLFLHPASLIRVVDVEGSGAAESLPGGGASGRYTELLHFGTEFYRWEWFCEVVSYRLGYRHEAFRFSSTSSLM